MQNANYHTHTNYSDGSSHPEAYIEKAIELGLDSIGISDHAPIPKYAQKWNMPAEKMSDYFEHLGYLKEKHRENIRVLTSLEIDYIPDLIHPTSDYYPLKSLDYTIGSIHYLGGIKNGKLWGFELLGRQLQEGLQEFYKGNVYKMVEEYYRNIREMVKYFTPDIVGHLDRIKIINTHHLYFKETENWYQDELKETLKYIADKKIVMEINTKGMYSRENTEPYPSFWILQMAKKFDIPIVLASDAHKPQFVNTGFIEIEQQLKDMGYLNTARF